MYELTGWGKELETILQQLGRWGVRSPRMPCKAPISKSTLMMAMRTMFDTKAAKGLKANYELRIGEERFKVSVENGKLEIARDSTIQLDAILQGDTAKFKILIFEGLVIQQVLDAGKRIVEGIPSWPSGRQVET